MPAKTTFDLMREIAIKVVVANSDKKSRDAAKWLKTYMEAQIKKTKRPICPNVVGLKEISGKDFVIGNLGQISDYISFLLQYKKAEKKSRGPIQLLEV